jgi:acyl-CoA thioesterase FadM
MSQLNSFIRVPALVLRQRFRPLPRIGLFDEDTVRMRVWPQDIDFNIHMNNSRYLSFMDYGRVHSWAAVGILDLAVRRGWRPLAGSISITYRRSLGLFDPFDLTSRLVCWDEKWFYQEHVFRYSQGLSAIAWVKVLFRGKEGNVPSQQVVDMVDPGAVSPPVSVAFEQWNALVRDKLQAGA